jgi:glc operon protein GlcG
MKMINNLGHLEAQKAIEVIQAELLKRGKAAVIAVADGYGELIALLRIDNVQVTSIQIAANKAYTAARERKPSHEIGEAARHAQDGFDISYYSDPRIIGFDGGLPVVAAGEVVGAVGVSGLHGSEDIELAQLGVDAIISMLKV